MSLSMHKRTYFQILLHFTSTGADLNAEDEDGDTCLHLSLMRRGVTLDPDASPYLSTVRK